MGLKTLLVCLTTPEHSETLMKVAVPLAQRHGAHLIGLHTIEALVVYPGIAVHIPEPAFAAFNQSQREEAEAVRAVFEKHTGVEEFASEFRMIRAEAVSATERIVECARAADLVLMPHEDRATDRYDQRHAQAQVIRESGRPVIVVPKDYEGPTIGDNILLGWSDTREAARSAHDLVQIAGEGTQVTVLRVRPGIGDEMRDFDGIDLSEGYARHGLSTTLEHRDPGSHSVADILSQVAFEKGADLIVTGAFGHSRAYDFVVGATTYALLRSAKIPVMFAK